MQQMYIVFIQFLPNFLLISWFDPEQP